MRRVISLCSLALATACAGPSRGQMSFQGRYIPSAPQTAPLPSLCAGVPELTVTTAQPNDAPVGLRFEEENPSVKYPIYMLGDHADYVRQVLNHAFKLAFSSTYAPVKLAVRVSQLDVQEKTFYNAELTAAAALDVTVWNKQGGVCWTGRVSGVGSNYGRAGTAENYEQTLSRALESATAELLSTPGFQDALCGKCLTP